MTNPFENEDGIYLVLINSSGQHSLWPEHIEVPGGWTIDYGPAARHSCLEHIDANWTNMRPTWLAPERDQ
jgi:MbtH protein